MRDLRCVVIGAGMAGILAAMKLREDANFGGTWRENT